MSFRVSESDWKIFRDLHEVALQRYCERVLQELAEICAERSHTPHERYGQAYTLIRSRDKELAQSFDDPRRSNAVTQLASLNALGLLEEGELAQFSEDTRSRVAVLTGAVLK